MSERACEWSERASEANIAKWSAAVRANKRSERPSGPFKMRLSRVETGPKSISYNQAKYHVL